MICLEKENFNKLIDIALNNCNKSSKKNSKKSSKQSSNKEGTPEIQLNTNNSWTYTPPTTCTQFKLPAIKIKKTSPIMRRNLADLKVPDNLLTTEHANLIRQKFIIFADIPIPDSFSWREKLGGKILPVQDQGNCGDCWAYSTTATLADRYAIKFGIPAPDLSVLWTVTNTKYYLNKSTDHYACEGGRPVDAVTLFQNMGSKLNDCWPMSMIDSKSNIFPQALMTLGENCCWNCCENTTSANKIYRSGPARYLSNTKAFSNADITKNIQLEIMNHGPVTAGFQVFTDFYYYWQNCQEDDVYIKNSVPIPVENKIEGWHAVEIVGWGKNQKGIRFWEVKNSWGLYGGNNGYCKIGFSLDVSSQENWCFLDIPDSNMNGGVIAFDAKYKPENSLNCHYNGSYQTYTDPNSGQTYNYCECEPGYFGDCQYTDEMCQSSGGIPMSYFGCLCGGSNQFANEPPFCKVVSGSCQNFCLQYFSNNYSNCMMNCRN